MQKNNNFHLIRFVAANLVIVGHSYDLLGQRSPSWFDAGVAAFAVRIFFVVSGYLICESWNNDPSLIRYIARRSLRIFPALIVVVILCVFVLGPLATEKSIPEYFSDSLTIRYFWNILLAPCFELPGVFAHNQVSSAVNGSLWTLPAEFSMYLLLPLYGLSARRNQRVLLPIAIVAFGGAGLYWALRPAEILPVVWWSSVPQILRWAPYFVFGAAIRVWRMEKFLNLHAAIVSLSIIGLVFNNDILRNSALMILIPYAVLSFCLTPFSNIPIFRQKADVSYGIYLYAFPIQQALIAHFGPQLRPIALIAMAMPVSWLCGFVSWRVIERPALKLKARHRRAASMASNPLEIPPGAPIANIDAA